MNAVKMLLFFAVFLSFLGVIWTPFHIQWALTGIYAFIISRYVNGNVLRGKIIGEEIRRNEKHISLLNWVKRV